MIRKVTLFILIILTALAQNCLFQLFQIAYIKPNLLLILTVSFGLMQGKQEGLWVGFFSGLALDLLFPQAPGLEALVYMWIGYGSGCCYRIFYDDDIKTPVMLVSAAGLIYGLYHYILTFLLRGRIHFFYYLGRIILPEILYSIVMTFIIYRIYYKINQALIRSERRRIDSFV